MIKDLTKNITGCIPIHKNHDRSIFDCGIEQLNAYLKNFALINQQNNSSKTYVALEDNKKVRNFLEFFK